jgi:cobalt-zinc-cadmium efflux system outer membrane protein
LVAQVLGYWGLTGTLRARITFHAVALLLFAGFSGGVSAGEAPPYEVLLRRSMDKAPVLLEQSANLRAARAEAQQAHAWRNPEIGLDVENLGAPGGTGGVSQVQTTLALTQPFEIGGKRSARIAAGSGYLRAAEARQHQAQIDYAAALALAYADAEAAQEREQLALEEVRRAEEDLSAANALVKAGREAQLRVEQAQASAAAASAARDAASADRIEALESLSVLAGIAEPYSHVPPSLLRTAMPMPAISGPPETESPAVLAAAAERDALAAQVRLERARPIPDIGLTAGLRKFDNVSRPAFVIGVSASIPLFDRNAGNIAAAQARRDAADTRLEAARLRANAGRRVAQAKLTAANRRLLSAAAGESAAAEAYRLSRIGYEAGRSSLMELLASRRALSEARILSVDARLAHVHAATALAQADGRLAFGE